MSSEQESKTKIWLHDFFAAWALFLVSIPISIGIAQSFGVSPYAGLLAGIIGGVVVGFISGSHTSVSGPSAGLTAIILTEMAALRGFETFLFALLLAGLIQIAFGLLRVGELADFLPSSVVKGLIAAVGVILILKQIPHLLGHDSDPMGEMSFWQPDKRTTFTEFLAISGDTHMGAVTIGIVSLIILAFWEFSRSKRTEWVPASLVVIVIGTALGIWLRRYDVGWSGQDWHFLRLPTSGSSDEAVGLFTFPNLEQWRSPSIYVAAVVIAVVASLESLLNLNAVDRLDPQRRHSPPNRELIAQGVGNTLAGVFGGLPIASRIVHSSVSINAGGRTKQVTIMHGILFGIGALLLPTFLNSIPLACIAAILLWTGAKMASPQLFRSVWAEGRYQFIPFIITMTAIIFTEKLIGAVIGLVIGVAFILNSNLRRPIRKVREKHIAGELIRIELGNQVSFLNRGMLERALRDVLPGAHVMLDATQTDYIDPDILSLIRDYKERVAPKYNIDVNLRGFKNKYSLNDETHFVDYSTRELQQDLKPREVLQILQDGNRRFQAGQPLFRDFAKQLTTAAQGQFPFAAVLSCIDSRAPVETIMDLGLGDIFSIRIAGNVVGPKVLGSLEYACGVAGSKLIVVLGHTKCGAVNASVTFACKGIRPEEATGCKHLDAIVDRVSYSIDADQCKLLDQLSEAEKVRFIEQVTRDNVLHSIRQIVFESPTLRQLCEEGKIAVVGAIYDVGSGNIDFLTDDAVGLEASPGAPVSIAASGSSIAAPVKT